MTLKKQFLAMFLLLCVVGDGFAQTFQYSRGWTNGKKRTPQAILLQDPSEANDVLGVCQMIRLREILTHNRHDQTMLPCEVIGKSEEEIIDRFRRKAGEFESSTFDTAHEQ